MPNHEDIGDIGAAARAVPARLIVLANLDVDDPDAIPETDNTDRRDFCDDDLVFPGDIAELTRLNLGMGGSPPRPRPRDRRRGAARRWLELSLSPQDARRVRLFAPDGAGRWKRVLGAAANSAAVTEAVTLPIPFAGDLELLVEAVTLPGAPSSPGGEILLTRSYRDAKGRAVGEDAPIRLSIAPWLLLSNLRPARRVYVHYLDQEDLTGNHPTLADLAAALRSGYGPAAAPDPDAPVSPVSPVFRPGRAGLLHIVDGRRFPELWLQDECEIGYCWAPHGWSHLLLHSPRDRELTGWVRRLPDSDMGLFDDLARTAPVDSTDFGGNLELSAPVAAGTATLPAGAAGPPVPAHGPAPFGKIMLGEHERPVFDLPLTLVPDLDAGRTPALADAFARTAFALRDPVRVTVVDEGREWEVTDRPLPSADGYERALRVFRIRRKEQTLAVRYVRSVRADHRRFLAAQGVQPLLPLDTTWLGVGHVDELVTVVPTPSGGARMVVASARLAVDLLTEASALAVREPEAGPVTAMFRGRLLAEPPTPQNTSKPEDPDPEEDPDGLQAPAIRPPADLSVTQALAAHGVTNADLQTSRLDPIERRLRDGLRLGDDAIVRLPVLFHALPQFPAQRLGMITSSGAGADMAVVHRTSALTPNMVNMLVVGEHLMVPRPLGPRLGRAGVRRILHIMGVPELDDAVLDRLEGHWHWATWGTDLDRLADVYDVDRDAIRHHPANAALFDPNGTTTRSWSRVWIPEDNIDLFEAYAVSVLAPLTVHFIDVWDPYHVAGGGLHCATNVVREPPEATAGYVGPYWWWEAVSR
ncbi:protein-arginine deiminase family protein [Thermopolyspora sp. NPDC052614]|uniref:protein-arginine deiminase family protein n=1 Tax=Thermopolyspora sp. NPDC052614 TaxID=3155682 RepID=UPI00342322C2